MTSRLFMTLALTTALGTAAFFAVHAQAEQPPGPSPAVGDTRGAPLPPPPDHEGRHGDQAGGRDIDRMLNFGLGEGPRRMGHLSAEDRAAFLDARIAAAKAALHLSPDQDKLWPPVETAVRDAIAKAQSTRKEFADSGRPKDPVDGLARMADVAQSRGEVLHKLVDAARPLYASLSEDQKRRLGMIMHPHGPEGWRQRIADHMRGWRDWGRRQIDGDARPGRGGPRDDDREDMGRPGRGPGHWRDGMAEPGDTGLFKRTRDAFSSDPSVASPTTLRQPL